MFQHIYHHFLSAKVGPGAQYQHDFEIPSSDRAKVCFVEGRIAEPEKQSCDHLNLMQALRDADRLNLRRLFHNLAPPPMDSLVGEYDAELLDQGGPLGKALTSRVFGMHGTWIGKAFQPVSENTGVGYNYFRSRGKIVRKLPMDTVIGPSTFDDGLALTIRYFRKNRGLVRWLFGEVRQLTPNVMLGIGVFGPSLRKDTYRRKIPFVLVGPCRVYQHAGASDVESNNE